MTQNLLAIKHIHQVSDCHLCSNLPIAIVYTDIQFNIIDANDQFFAQYGYTQNQQRLTVILNHSEIEKKKLVQNWQAKFKQLYSVNSEVATRYENGTLGLLKN